MDIATHLADANFTVCLIGRNKEKLLTALNELTTQYPDRHHTMHECDITKRDDRDTTVDEIIRIHGTPDLLINNAAIIGDPKSLDEHSEEEIERLITTNLTGTVFFTRKVSTELLK